MVRCGFCISLLGITSMIACAIASYTITQHEYLLWIVSSAAIAVIGNILIFGEMINDWCLRERRTIAPAPTDMV